jgi:hypothetical protein
LKSAKLLPTILTISRMIANRSTNESQCSFSHAVVAALMDDLEKSSTALSLGSPLALVPWLTQNLGNKRANNSDNTV